MVMQDRYLVDSRPDGKYERVKEYVNLQDALNAARTLALLSNRTFYVICGNFIEGTPTRAPEWRTTDVEIVGPHDFSIARRTYKEYDEGVITIPLSKKESNVEAPSES